MTEQISSIINQKDPIANRRSDKNLKPIANSLLVDTLLSDYSDLIDHTYVKWFAKRFYTMPFDLIHRCASEARQDGKNPQRLFVFLIKKNSVL